VIRAVRLSPRREIQVPGETGVGEEVVWGEFVRRIALGDSSALEVLLSETKRFVFGRALRILSFRADAEEITADVYSQVWRTAGQYDQRRGGVLAWLMNIAKSRATDRLRSRASHERRSEMGLYIARLYVERSIAINPETDAACHETRRLVRQALKALPVEQRRAIELAYFQGYSMPEIASRLGHPLGTVKSRIRAGLIGLRRLIAATEAGARHRNGQDA
jgi:RNA polymerase sigma-70 factor (ECF subfamily)